MKKAEHVETNEVLDVAEDTEIVEKSEKEVVTENKNENKGNAKKVAFYALSTTFLWGSAFPISKIVQEQFSHGSLGFIRCTVASIFLLVLGRIFKSQLPKKEDIYLFALGGITGFALYMTVFNIGLSTITAATSSIIIASTPVVTPIGAMLVYKEKLSLKSWCCILSAFVGVLILLLWDGFLSINVGILWTMLAVLSFCAYNLVSRELIGRGYKSLEIATYSMCFGAIFLSMSFGQSIEELKTASPSHLMAMAYLSILCSACAYLLWGKAMTYAEKTSEVMIYMFTTSFISTILGFILLKEMPNLGTFIGGAIIVSSMVIFQLQQEK